CIVEPMIFEVEPLAHAESRCMACKALERGLRGAVLTQQSHIEVSVIRGTLRFSMPRRCLPGARQVVQAVPINPGRASDEQLGRAIDAPCLHFLRAEARYTHSRHPQRFVVVRADLSELVRPLVDLP